MNSWHLKTLDLDRRLPEILSSSSAARAIVLDLAAGESLDDHEVHERAWMIVIDGEAEISTSAGESVSGGAGLLVELAPGERHEVTASSQTRLLLLLTPWPGSGHPGAMSIRDKLYARRHAAKRVGGDEVAIEGALDEEVAAKGTLGEATAADGALGDEAAPESRPA